MIQRFKLSSRLAATVDEVWTHATGLRGVNEEMAPWVRMVAPRGRELTPRQIDEPGEFFFPCWILGLGILPVDRHYLYLRRMRPPRLLHEDSTTWLQRRWVHIRRIEAADGGCEVTDELEFEPRLAVVGGLSRRIVRRLFERRHRYLVRRFGNLDQPSALDERSVGAGESPDSDPSAPRDQAS